MTAVGYSLGLRADHAAESPAELVELSLLLSYICQSSRGGLHNRQIALQPQNVVG
jgi:hypothetical protein